MATNAFCACGSLAIRFCICQKPRKLYLCNNCTNTHINKLGAHSFFDAKVNDLLDSELYNIRTQNTCQLRARIDQLCHLVQKEQSGLGDAINAMYQKQCQELFQAYQKAWNEVNAVYQEILTMIEEGKRDAEKLETSLKVEIAPTTWNVMQLCWHEESRVDMVLNVTEETSKSLKFQEITKAETVIDSWGCKQIECSMCKVKAKELSIEPLIICQVCQYKYSIFHQSCTKCEEKLRISESQAVAVVPNSFEWTCPCGTRQSGAKCPNCSMWKAAAVNRFPSQQIAYQPATRMWHCGLCGNSNPMAFMGCAYCGGPH